MRAFRCDADRFRRLRDGVAAWRRDLGFALSFLTRLPVPAAWGMTDAPGRGLRAFPLMGALLGLATGLVYAGLLALSVPPLAAAAVALATLTAATGALHEDGVADCADAFGAAGAETARRLEILKDPRVGAFGALAVTAVFVIRVACVADLSGAQAVLALVAAEGASRAAPALLLWTTPPARPDGLAAAMGTISRAVALTAAALAALLLWSCLGAGLGLVAVGGGGLVLLVVRRAALRRLGGVVGDVLGLGQQACGTAMLLATAATW